MHAVPFARQRQDGVALVLVLAFLVILSVLILTFFTSVSTESSSAAAYSHGTAVKMLADSAVHVAEGQIRDATQGEADSSRVMAWASQPGMIRTFDTSGSPEKIYKLYSSDQMVVGATGFVSEGKTLPADWKTGANAEIYTDLNAPEVYRDSEETDPTKTQLIYPIVDPSAEDAPTGGIKVQGFSISNPPGYTGADPSPTNNPAPMPVKWLYLLQDGQIVAPTLADPETVQVLGATLENPITGRIAFWADDETAKVNINTASEGVFWDVPRIYSVEDFGKYSGGTTISQSGYAVSQPAQGEFQRYPGHPATTSLSVIFGDIPQLRIPATLNAGAVSIFDRYYNMVPRVGTGGSSVGTRRASTMKLDNDRLYASIDELMFSQTFSGAARVPNTAGSGSKDPALITKQVIEQAKFFLTASSSAPETTLYNTPRIAMWPVWTTEAKRTAYDKLAAFCASIGSKVGDKEFYFARMNSRSMTHDFDRVPRNQKLYKYLQALTSRPVPGFGGNFVTKYTELERDQILTYIYDYIRITNTQDRTVVTGTQQEAYTKLFDTLDPKAGAGEVLPIRIGDTQGFGRFYTIAEAALLFYGTAGELGKPSTKIQSVFLTEFASPAQGMGAVRNGMKYIVKGLDQLEVKFSADGSWMPLGFPKEGTNTMARTDLSTYHGRSIGGTEGPAQAIFGKTLSAGGGTGGYPFFTRTDITVPTTPGAPGAPAASAQTFWLQTAGGAEITVEIRTADTNQVVQTVHLQFPATELKMPTRSKDYSVFNTRLSVTPNINSFTMVQPEDTMVSLEPAGAKGTGNDPEPEFQNTAGDIRLIAGLADVPSTQFRAHNNYLSGPPSGRQWAHGMMSAIGEKYSGGTNGNLVANANSNYRQVSGISRQPDVPSRVQPNKGVTRADGGRGDWDTGFGDQKDGAYINKPDEGDTNLDDQVNGQRLPYNLGGNAGYAAAQSIYFSPNRQVASPIMLGSIPTGVKRGLPWQTLLFHPRPEDPGHPGRATPPDHLLADLFWMPVIEPYAISQPFSTAGKINMNYQIEPFNYIRRDTGLQAVMKSTKFLAIPAGDARTYKPLDPGNNAGKDGQLGRRKTIDMEKTLKAFDDKFANGEVFKSATQISEMDLVPLNSNGNMTTFWNQNTLTGDNLREKPYADIYPRLTTKSNTYTIHVRVQALKKATGGAPEVWNPKRDSVLAEYRGSSLVERYIDVNDPRLPDFAVVAANNPSDPTLNIDQYYKMRVISTRRFSP